MKQGEASLSLTNYLASYAATWNASYLRERLALYDLVAQKFISPKTSVIDVGCGEGFGANYLSRHARRVTGIDISRPVVDHANSSYASDKLQFTCLDIMKDRLTLKADVVCALDLLEHLEDDMLFLQKLRKLTKKGGVILVATPNKLVHTIVSGEIYEFHVREYFYSELCALLESEFRKNFQVLCLNPGYISRISLKQIIPGRLKAALPTWFKDAIKISWFQLSRPFRNVRQKNLNEISLPQLIEASKAIAAEDCSDYLAVIENK